MTEEVKEVQDNVELIENEDVLEAHDPKNAEAQSVASVDKAGDATKSAPKRKGDKSNSEKMTKLGMVNAMYNKLAGMSKSDLSASYTKMMGESVEIEDETLAVRSLDEYREDLTAMMGTDESLSEEFKEKASLVFEAAVNSRVDERVATIEAELTAEFGTRIDSLEEQYATEIEAGLTEARDGLVEKIDSYLNYVVETWMEENKLAVEQGLRTEIAETFMGNLKNLFVESYIEVPESKVDLVDDLVGQIETLEERLDKETANNIVMRESNEDLMRKIIIREASKDLAETQVSKLEKMAEGIEYGDEESFTDRVNTIKESYFKTATTEATEEVETVDSINESVTEEEVQEEVHSSSMDKYLTAMRNTYPKK